MWINCKGYKVTRATGTGCGQLANQNSRAAGEPLENRKSIAGEPLKRHPPREIRTTFL